MRNKIVESKVNITLVSSNHKDSGEKREERDSNTILEQNTLLKQNLNPIGTEFIVIQILL